MWRAWDKFIRITLLMEFELSISTKMIIWRLFEIKCYWMSIPSIPIKFLITCFTFTIILHISTFSILYLTKAAGMQHYLDQTPSHTGHNAHFTLQLTWQISWTNIMLSFIIIASIWYHDNIALTRLHSFKTPFCVWFDKRIEPNMMNVICVTPYGIW